MTKPNTAAVQSGPELSVRPIAIGLFVALIIRQRLSLLRPEARLWTKPLRSVGLSSTSCPSCPSSFCCAGSCRASPTPMRARTTSCRLWVLARDKLPSCAYCWQLLTCSTPGRSQSSYSSRHRANLFLALQRQPPRHPPRRPDAPPLHRRRESDVRRRTGCGRDDRRVARGPGKRY